LGIAALLCVACGEPPAAAPSAVISADPTSVCLGDDFASEIRLDAGDSQSHLTLVPVAPNPDEPPLAFSWSFAGAEHRIVEGDVHAQTLLITSRGDRPLHVSLHVKNSEGGEADALLSIAVTPCP
jgi:hypothetical protein